MSTFLHQLVPTVLAGLASVAVISQGAVSATPSSATPLSATPLSATPLSATPLSLTRSLIAQQPDCNNAQTQADMNICAAESYEQADRALNRAYQALVPNLAATRRQKLTDAQLRWIKFRDTECDFAGSEAEGGSMHPMLISGCSDRVTQQRTDALEAYLSGQNLSGGGSYQAADRRLNQLYQQLRKGLAGDRQRKLETAEFAWIAFRDSACGFEASGGGNAARNQCLTRLTNQRNQQLQRYLAVDR